jgi:hypothetical protein
MNENVIGFGPFIGDFEQEITTFRPYVEYIIHKEKINPQSVYVSSHKNRKFLYNFLNQEKFIPIYENITRNELEQNGYLYNDISKQDFVQLIRLFKNYLAKRESCQISTIKLYTIPYIKRSNFIGFDEKIFNKIKINPIDIIEQDFVVMIPDNNDYMYDLYIALKEYINVIVIGDLKTGLPEENLILKNNTYFHDNYNTIINYLQKSKLVITPISHWAFVCNLQQIPLFYWGDQLSMYKTDGIYGFNNQNVMSVCDMNFDNLLKQILNYYENLGKLL